MRAGPWGLRLEGPPTRRSRIEASRPFAAEKTLLPDSNRRHPVRRGGQSRRRDPLRGCAGRALQWLPVQHDRADAVDGRRPKLVAARAHQPLLSPRRAGRRPPGVHAGRTCGRRGHGHADVLRLPQHTAVAVHGPLVGGEDAVGPPASEDCSRSAGWNEETRVTPASFDMRQAPFAGGYFTGDYEGLGFASSDGDAVGPASDVFVSYFSQLHVATRRAPCRACWRLRRTQADWDAPLGPGPGRIPRAECARPRRLGRPPPTRRAVAFGSPLPIFAVGLVL
jgi:hypothetical protein